MKSHIQKNHKYKRCDICIGKYILIYMYYKSRICIFILFIKYTTQIQTNVNATKKKVINTAWDIRAGSIFRSSPRNSTRKEHLLQFAFKIFNKNMTMLFELNNVKDEMPVTCWCSTISQNLRSHLRDNLVTVVSLWWCDRGQIYTYYGEEIP